MVHAKGVADFMQNQVIHAVPDQLLLNGVAAPHHVGGQIGKYTTHPQHVLNRAQML